MRIYLIGFMGCGKTTIGKRLAARCGFSFLDTDELFAAVHQCSINDYFSLYTEENFRREETKILHLTQQMDDAVVALGGGTPCFGDNMQWILSHGIAVYIKMPPMSLYSRLANSKKERPLLSLPNQDIKDTIETLLSQREPVYDMAHITVPGIDFNLEDLLVKLNAYMGSEGTNK